MTYIKSRLIINSFVAIGVSFLIAMIIFNISISEWMFAITAGGYKSMNSDRNSFGYFAGRMVLPSFKNSNEYHNNFEKNIENYEITSEGKSETKPNKENIINSSQISRNLQIKNETDYQIDIQSMLAEKPNLSFEDKSNPQFLIVHTHASESYASDRDYELTDTDRTQDNRYNMIRVGEELKRELENKGYNVIHDKTIHDYPSYTSSYRRCSETIQSYLNKYPSIQAVFDLHRDAIIDKDGNRVGLVGNVGEEECAQIMLVCGTDKNNLKFDLWEENLRFAMKIQDYMESKYPDIIRPLNLRKERFNLHMTNGSILFEIGTNGNSLNQAVTSVKYLADGIDHVCKSINN